MPPLEETPACNSVLAKPEESHRAIVAIADVCLDHTRELCTGLYAHDFV